MIPALDLDDVPHLNIATHILDSQHGNDAQERIQRRMGRSLAAYCEMHEALAATHRFVRGLPFMWERWVRKCHWAFHGCYNHGAGESSRSSGGEAGKPTTPRSCSDFGTGKLFRCIVA